MITQEQKKYVYLQKGNNVSFNVAMLENRNTLAFVLNTYLRSNVTTC